MLLGTSTLKALLHGFFGRKASMKRNDDAPQGGAEVGGIGVTKLTVNGVTYECIDMRQDFARRDQILDNAPKW